MQELSSNRIADANEVLEYLTTVMRGESKSEVVVVISAGDFTTEAKKINKNPDEKEKLKAAELLSKRYGLNYKNSTDGNIPIVICDDINE